MKQTPTPSEKFMDLYHSQPLHMGDKNRYYVAVHLYEEETGVKAPYSSYDSFKSMKKKLMKI